ncbi:hypothetical protein EMVG_00016 [Emiliania huxleyi virus PS401]|nr:hypothetical protein EMVG_00016 [Emiliania huxleyi virus PS401]
MGYSFPLSLAQFHDLLRKQAADCNLGEALDIAETGGGEILSARIGNRLWAGSYTLHRQNAVDQEPILALIDLIRSPGRSFFTGDVAHRYPRLDPDGSILGATAVTVQSVEANNRELKLQGAPDGYTVSAGDHISIIYGSSPVKYGYFRVVSGSSFNDAFTPTRTGLIEVQPFIPAGITGGETVQLVEPRMKAVYVPGSFSGGGRVRPMKAGPIQFSWRQSLR